MNVTSVTPSPSQNAAGGQNSLADQFDDFLTLLTKQLEYQDPLSPMDATAFTEQLVQFTEVEQSVAMNQKLDTLVSQLTQDTLNRGIGYLGTQVDAGGRHLVLGEEGVVRATATLEANPAQVIANVRNANGDVVRTWRPDLSVGTQTLVWDGLGDQGNRLPPGTYELELDARDNRGQIVPVSTTVSGVVTGVEDRNGQLILWVGDRELAVEDVTTVRTQTASAASAASTESQDDGVTSGTDDASAAAAGTESSGATNQEGDTL